jgi:D-aminoacyl-tRNA deacylase
MRAVVQRVSRAQVTVHGDVVGQIGQGWCALVGVTHSDTETQAHKLADKIANLRMFDDDNGVMNRSVTDIDGAILVVSQFTLYGDASKGRRPAWGAAAPAPVAEPLVVAVVDRLLALGLTVETGRFQADMVVDITNVGPATLVIDVD